MQPKIKILYTEEEIKKRIAELASKITRDYAGREITLVGVLKGAFIFMADLARGIQLDTRCDFVRVSSYKDDKATGVVRMEFDVTQPIAGQDVILVEDIIDSGRTIEYLKRHLMQGKPRSLKICTLLYKDGNGLREEIDYIGFVVPKRYIVGYGLDSMGLCRNLPYIGYIEG